MKPPVTFLHLEFTSAKEALPFIIVSQIKSKCGVTNMQEPILLACDKATIKQEMVFQILPVHPHDSMSKPVKNQIL